MSRMDLSIKRKVAVGVVAVAVAAGGGIAYAASTSTDPQKEREAFLQDAAKRLNVSPDKLESALTDAAKARLDQAVKDGRLTQAQADELKQRLDKGGVPLVGPGLGMHEGMRFGPGHHSFGLHFEAMDAVAKYLGVTRAELMQQLRDGKSLADVAKAKGKDVNGLKDAIVAAAKSDLDQAVKDKDLTQAQADQALDKLKANVDDLVQGTMPKFRGGWKDGHRGGFAPPPDMDGAGIGAGVAGMTTSSF